MKINIGAKILEVEPPSQQVLEKSYAMLANIADWLDNGAVIHKKETPTMLLDEATRDGIIGDIRMYFRKPDNQTQTQT